MQFRNSDTSTDDLFSRRVAFLNMQAVLKILNLRISESVKMFNELITQDILLILKPFAQRSRGLLLCKHLGIYDLPLQ